jgi:hypothetical protein
MTAIEFDCYMAAVLGLMVLIWYFSGLAPVPSGVIPGMYLLQVLMFAVISPYMILQAQRPFLARHLLMTVRRRQWVALIFRETARDYIPVIFLGAISILAVHWWGPVDLWPIWHLALFGLGCMTLIYGVQLVVATYSMWVQFAASIGMMFGPMLCVLITTNSAFEKSMLSMILNWPPTWWIGLFALSAVAIRFAHHRWMNWEIGQTVG